MIKERTQNKLFQTLVKKNRNDEKNSEFNFNRTRGKSSNTKTSASGNYFKILPDLDYD